MHKYKKKSVLLKCRCSLFIYITNHWPVTSFCKNPQVDYVLQWSIGIYLLLFCWLNVFLLLCSFSGHSSVVPFLCDLMIFFTLSVCYRFLLYGYHEAYTYKLSTSVVNLNTFWSSTFLLLPTPLCFSYHILHLCILYIPYIQLTREQHGFELHRLTYTWIFFFH